MSLREYFSRGVTESRVDVEVGVVVGASHQRRMVHNGLVAIYSMDKVLVVRSQIAILFDGMVVVHLLHLLFGGQELLRLSLFPLQT